MSRVEYDDQNIFARILRGEIPCNKVDECDHTLSFYDIQPQLPVHILVIPKGSYVDMSDFCEHASEQEQTAFMAAIARVVRLAGLDENGCRMISNQGRDGHQEVPHLHVHILGGDSTGPLLSARAP